MGIMPMLFKGDIILCCACEAGLWRVRYDSYPDPVTIWKELIPLNADVPTPNGPPKDIFDRKTFLPGCPFCNEVVVTATNDILTLQRGKVPLISPAWFQWAI